MTATVVPEPAASRAAAGDTALVRVPGREGRGAVRPGPEPGIATGPGPHRVRPAVRGRRRDRAAGAVASAFPRRAARGGTSLAA